MLAMATAGAWTQGHRFTWLSEGASITTGHAIVKMRWCMQNQLANSLHAQLFAGLHTHLSLVDNINEERRCKSGLALGRCCHYWPPL